MTVNVGRAGAANLDVIQEVDYVKQEAKIVYLLECLQKTPPPVCVCVCVCLCVCVCVLCVFVCVCVCVIACVYYKMQ